MRNSEKPRIAIVFDGAGVIYEPVRIVKDMRSGDIKQSRLSGIHLADKVEGVFVMIRAKIREMMRGEECLESLSHFLVKKNIPIVVIYKSNKCRKLSDDDVRRIVLSDERVKLNDVYDTISILLKYDILPVIGTGLVVSVRCDGDREARAQANRKVEMADWRHAGGDLTGVEGRDGASGKARGEIREVLSGELGGELGGEVRYVISGGINLFPETVKLFENLRRKDIAVFIASGDRIERDEISPFLPGVPAENIYGMLSPDEKCKLVKRLRREYDKVMMVGDDKNDYYAMCAADISVLSLQIESERPKQLFDIADFVIKNIREVEGIVDEIERG